MPAARMPTAVSSGGIEECPPSAWAVSATVTYPFSAIPTSATGAEMPATNPVASAPPSSSTNSGCTLRDASRSAMWAAPRRPPALRSRLHRHHVLMREQDDRWAIRIGSGPLVQQAVPVHLLELERGMEPGERGP